MKEIGQNLQKNSIQMCRDSCEDALAPKAKNATFEFTKSHVFGIDAAI